MPLKRCFSRVFVYLYDNRAAFERSLHTIDYAYLMSIFLPVGGGESGVF